MPKHKAGTSEQGPTNPQVRYPPIGITPRTELGFERLVFFSDAVIAIAITLLALEIRLPDQTIAPPDLTGWLVTLTPRYLTFFISFFVIGLFWMSHHRMFEYIYTYDRNLIWINLIFLFLVAFIPFPTAVLGRFPAELPSVALYAGIMVCLSLARVWSWWYVYYRAHLIRPDTNPRAGRVEMRRALWTGAIFGISILVALRSPGLAMFSWLLILPASILTRSPS
jgi:uncharacterized membrane protein